MGCNTDLCFQVLVPLPCRGLELCSRRYLLGLAHRKARAARQRERRPFAVASRCNFGEPMQLQLWVRIFYLQSRRRTRCRAGPRGFCKLRDDGIVPLICPTCQNVFAGAQSIHASDHHATLHGVVFDILVGSESLVLPELVMNRRSEPQNPHASSV